MDAKIVFGSSEQSAPLGGAYDTLFRIKLLLRAHAVAGIALIGEPEPQGLGPDGHDSTLYRVCPWDIIFKVECRIERCMRDVPYDQAKAWLIRLFDQEQRYWIESVRDNRNLTIGQVMQQSLIHREAIWSQPVLPSPLRDRAASSRESDALPKPKITEAGDKAEAADAKKFCSGFNRGKCPYGSKCRFQHRCDKKTGTRPDGSPHYCNGKHPACEHDKVVNKTKSAGSSAKDKQGSWKPKWPKRGGKR